MSNFTSKIYKSILQLSIIGFSFSLVWFAFVYYPTILDNYKTGNILKPPVIKPISAKTTRFPIETSAFKLSFEESSQTYYAFIQGKSLDKFVQNKQSAELSLKTALSAEKLCNVQVIYVSMQNLKIPDQYKGSTGCK